ncbi:tRNA(His) guanylyltransferase Thg1 family protein [Enterovirga rhinocerotis]|uniref:tRNA(His) 5'-end guanylyltransferase n=1 Tax=Enterovirga rhinocerotis TaxID=1339210 RepID=A0A4R7C198_9HYPH|nr:tRNA(His) guanylyltransferase Thg1 family protein [Enterovirga rhinocerotis]TDR90267.1 tRNA(His) 5'-end guanylyltransferase [Enterovirga rhinocerotis]
MAGEGDDLGDRMKGYEAVETGRRLPSGMPIYARIDGRSFSRFTRGMHRPFDELMSQAMISATGHLVETTGAVIGYTQSDEISLVWQSDPANPASQVFFDGKVQKLASVLAGIATAAFTRAILASELSSYAERLPHFDGRVFSVPDRDEATNAFLWRALDAERNAVQMAAHAVFSAKAMFKKPVRELRKMLAEKGVDFAGYPPWFKFGTFVRRAVVERTLTDEELARIPEANRPTASATFLRGETKAFQVPAFVEVENRAAVIFDGAEPIYRDGATS